MTEHPKLESTLRRMTLVYLAQVAVMMTFGLVALYVRSVQPIDNELANLLQYILAGLLIGALVSIQFVPPLLIGRINRQLDLIDKISKYFPIVLVRSAILEIPGLFAGLATLLTGRSYFMVVVVLLMAAFYFYRPSGERIAEELSLDFNEREQLVEALRK